MLAMPFVVGLIIGTAFLTAVVSTAIPHMPKLWNAFKSRIKRKSNDKDIVDVIIIAQLQDRIDELEAQMENIAEVKYNREKNRKSNIRREVRDYLSELKNG